MKEQRSAKDSEEAARDGFTYATLWNHRLLTPIGVWPLEKNASKSKRRVRTIRLVFSSSLISLYMIPQLFYILTGPSRDLAMQIVAPDVFYLSATMKFVILIINGENIDYCMSCMKKDWAKVMSKENRETMIRSAKFGRYMTIWSLSCMYPGIAVYNVIWPYLNVESKTTRENISNAERSLPYPMTYLIIDELSTPVFEITWLIQFFASTYLCFLNCGVYSFTGILVAHACGQLKIISSRFKRLAEDKGNTCENAGQKLPDIVEHHLQVIRYTEYVNKSFQVTFLVDEVGAIIIVCFLGYWAIHDWDRYHSAVNLAIIGTIMIGNISNLFIVSIAGQRLQDESQRVGIATARVEWYRLSPGVARSLVLCMIGSARPLRLSACSMVDMSLVNFGDVLRGAVVFLNMVRKMTNM